MLHDRQAREHPQLLLHKTPTLLKQQRDKHRPFQEHTCGRQWTHSEEEGQNSKCFYYENIKVALTYCVSLCQPAHSQRGLPQNIAFKVPSHPCPINHYLDTSKLYRSAETNGTSLEPLLREGRGQAGSALAATGQLSSKDTVTTHQKGQADNAASNGSHSKKHTDSSICKRQGPELQWVRLTCDNCLC